MQEMTPQQLIALLQPVSSEFEGTAFHGEFLHYLHSHAERLSWLVKQVQQTGRAGEVLDAGSYPGHTTLALHSLGYRVTALNPVMEGYASWEPYRASMELRDIPLLSVDLEREYLPGSGEQYDQVVFSEVIEHLPFNPFHAMAELCRVLRPGGLLWLSTPNIACARYIFRLLRGETIFRSLDGYWCKAFPTAPGAKHEREYTARELQYFLRPGNRFPYRYEQKALSVHGWFDDERPTGSRFWNAAERALVRAFPGLHTGLAAVASKPEGLILMSPDELRLGVGWDQEPFDPKTVKPPSPAPFPYRIRYLRGNAELRFSSQRDHDGQLLLLLPMIWHATEPPLPSQQLQISLRIGDKVRRRGRGMITINPGHEIQVVRIPLGRICILKDQQLTILIKPENLVIPHEILNNGDHLPTGPALAEMHWGMELK